jgi:IS30 family transposase
VLVVGRRVLVVDVRRGFWRGVRSGASSEVAARAVGVSGVTGRRWFAQAGGMPDVSLNAPSGRFLSLAEREEIALGLARGQTLTQIARGLRRSPSTISREVARNGSWRGYRAVLAQARSEQRARRPKALKLAVRPRLRAAVQARLEQRWSPQQIAARLAEDFGDDEQMRISHETIYRALYVQGRGSLRRELATCLRTGRATRRPRRRVGVGKGDKLKNMIMISQRPAEAADRAVPGHWEGDLIIGKNNKSAIGTLVERSTRHVMLLHLPNGYSAEQVRDAMLVKIGQLPIHLRRSLTWDQGSEMGRHADITLATDMPIYFCDPHSPWQRGSNENTNGLLRQYFPKGADLSVHTAEHLDAVAVELNGRPRQTLNWATPAETLNRLLSTPQDHGVATTT